MTQPNIRKSVTAWNEWRISNPDAIPYLEGAYLEGVTGVIDAGTTARGYRMVAVCHESDVYVASGCRWFTSAEALAYWSMANADYVARHGATTVARMAVRVRALIEEARLFGWTVAAPREEV